MSQPIFFTDAPGLLPVGMTYNVTRVTTPTGNGYTKLATKGITSSNWDAPTKVLSLGLTKAGSTFFRRHKGAKGQLVLQEKAGTRRGDVSQDIRIAKP